MQLNPTRGERGITAIETALMMSFILLMMYALVQTSLSSYFQVSADGATFVGSHTAVANETSAGASQSVAAQVAENVFAGLGKATVTLVHPDNTTTETDITFASQRTGLPGYSTPALTSREVETSADTSDNLTPMFPPAGSVECIENKINTTTGTTAIKPIGDLTAGTLVNTNGAVNGITGAANITQASIDATFGVLPPTGLAPATGPIGPLTLAAEAAQGNAALATNLQTIDAGVAQIAAIPVVGPAVAMQITGVATSANTTTITGAPLPLTVAGMISGPTGAAASALTGTLTSAQVAGLTSLIGSAGGTVNGVPTAASGIIGTITSKVGVNLPSIQPTLTALGQITPDLTYIDNAELAIATVDKTVSNQACP